MKKNIFIYSLAFSAMLLQSACKPQEQAVTEEDIAYEKNIVHKKAQNEEEKPVPAQEIISKDGKLKLSTIDFIFADKLVDPEFIKENPLPGTSPKDQVEIYQLSPDNVLLSAVKNEKLLDITKDSAEKKLTENTELKNVQVDAVNNKEKGVSYRYHYSFTDKSTNTLMNESCAVLEQGYFVCATGEKDLILLDRLVDSVEIIKTK